MSHYGEPPVGPTASTFDDGLLVGENVDLPGRYCPTCQGFPVRVQRFMWVTSFLIVTRHAEYSQLVCRACATRIGTREMIKSALLGWWGVPWGLLTFKALWIDARTLMRWSTLGPIGGGALGLLGAAIPFAIAALFYTPPSPSDERVHEAAVAYVEEAREHQAEGELEDAVQAHRNALASAPESMLIRIEMALLQANVLGDLETASRYAAEAESLQPKNPIPTAVHGYILLRSGRVEEAESRHRALVGRTVSDPTAAGHVAALMWAFEDWPEIVRIADEAGDRDRWSDNLRLAELRARYQLGDFPASQAALDALPEALRTEPEALAMTDALTLRSSGAGAADAMLQHWVDPRSGLARYDTATTTMLAEAARASGSFETVAHQVRDWLEEPTTPGDAWEAALPWFDSEQAVRDAAVRYTETRIEMTPGLYALSDLRPVTDYDRFIALQDELRKLEHVLQPMIERQFFVFEGFRFRPDDGNRRLVAHVEENPDHSGCRLALAGRLAERDPDTASRFLDEVTNPSLGAAVEAARLDLVLAQGDLDDAERRLDGISAPARGLFGAEKLAVRRAEILLRRGRPDAVEEALAPVWGAEDPWDRAPALVLRWAAQAASGQPSTYRADVEAWLGQAEAASNETFSASAHSILWLEGRSEETAVTAAIRDHSPATVLLVAALRAAATAGRPAPETLGAIVDLGLPHAWGSRLARAIGDGDGT